MTDLELLRFFTSEDSNAAFTQLTTRHAGLVYAAALRQTRSTALASDIVQSVFLDLAKNARHLRADTHLPSWLITVTRRTAIDTVRRESRRQIREQTSAELAAVNTHDSTNSSASYLAPILDDALTALSDSDRRAVLLRFFENQSFQQIARHLGATEATAQKRVSRALEKLRTTLARRGIATSAALLAAQLPLHASATLPATLATTLAAPAFLSAASAITAATTVSLAQTLLMTATQKTILVSALALSLAAIVVQTNRLSDNRSRLSRTETALAAAEAKIASLQTRLSSAELSARPATLSAPVSPAEQRLRTLLARVEKLKAVFDLTPDEKIPELTYLTENDWINAAMARPLEKPGDFELAQASLRSTAKYNFAPRIQAALLKYAAASDGQLPSSTAQLLPFFDPAIDATILDRYEMRATGSTSTLGPRDFVIIEKPGAFADSPVDRLLKISLRYIGSEDMPEMARKQAIFESRPRTPLPNYLQAAENEARNAYRVAHQGDTGVGIDALRPYFKNPEHAEKIFRYYTSRDPETGQPIKP